jgi:hypothetical protein
MPVNTSDMKKIISGKPVFIPVWELKVIATPVIGIAGEIFPAEAHFEKLLRINSAEDLQINVVYDNIKLDSFDFSNPQPHETVVTLKDDHEITDHTLEITLSGMTSSHMYDDDSVSWLVKIEVYIENLPILLEDDAVKILGENGTTSLSIATPVYRWLLDRDTLIRKAYCVTKV